MSGLEKHQKPDLQNGKSRYTITMVYYLKLYSPWQNLKTKLCHGPFKCEKYQKCLDNLLTFLWCTQMKACVEKVDMLIWTLSHENTKTKQTITVQVWSPSEISSPSLIFFNSDLFFLWYSYYRTLFLFSSFAQRQSDSTSPIIAANLFTFLII